MASNTEGNLLEIMDLARTLRQEQLFIQQEQAAFAQLTESLAANSTSITKLAYVCAQHRQNLNDLIRSRPEVGPTVCCRRAKYCENLKFIEARKVLDYEHAIAYEELFNFLYRSPYLLAVSLATGDRLPEISQQHMNSVIHTLSTGLFGNAIITKDVEMLLKLLRELIEIQIVVSDNPRRLLRTNASAFSRLYQRLNESMFSAKIFLTAALYEPIMSVLSECEEALDTDANKIVNNLTSKERLRRFGEETSDDYQQNIEKFRDKTVLKLQSIAKTFIENLIQNWSLFPSTLRWLVQTMSHQLKQAHYSDKIINEILTDMVFTHFICPAIVSPDILGIIEAPISEQIRFNLMQIGQIIQMLALAKFEDVDAKYSEIYAKFEANMVTNLIDLLLVSETGEDVVAILSQQSDFERSHLLSTQNELQYFIEFFRILMASEEFEIAEEQQKKLTKILAHLPELEAQVNNATTTTTSATNGTNGEIKERTSNKSLISFATKATKAKIAKSKSFNTNGNGNGNGNGGIDDTNTAAFLVNGNGSHCDANTLNATTSANGSSNASSANSSPMRMLTALSSANNENQAVLVFNLYRSDEHKLQPLTEEEVLKMNSIGQEISNTEALLVDPAESAILEGEHTNDKSSVATTNGFDGISDSGLRPLHHAKTHTRFSLSHDDASIGNSDNLEVVSEAPSNHSVTSSLELEEENDQNDNLSDMVSANVSGRGSPNISGRDTPSSQVTDGGEPVHNALPTPQMQKLISKVRSDIEDKFCKFELKKFEGDETVSIISDTWSTDVLASDNETVPDASERGGGDRNFSTPLIPSAVVLPGDNNFDVRPIYLDATDQRSESNWSTDVLASDSEKFAEVDTDDNVSVTAKSDITDSGARSEQERDQLAAAISAAPMPTRMQRLTEANYSRNTERRLRCAGNNNEIGRANAAAAGVAAATATAAAAAAAAAVAVGVNEVGIAGDAGSASDRSQEDSAFYDAVNTYEDVANGKVSSLARSSVRTTNQLSGENTFQQEYKSSNNEDNKDAYLIVGGAATSTRMRRQTSAESSISNQSLNLDEGGADLTTGKPPKAHHNKSALRKTKHHHHHHGHGQRHSYGHHKSGSDHKDLIDFSDFGVEEKRQNSSSKQNETFSELIEIFGMSSGAETSTVERRHTTTEQRTVVCDGRRNGILAMKNGADKAKETSASNFTTPALRRHQSLNYENHEIMLTSISANQQQQQQNTQRASAMPSLQSSTLQTDDEKCREQQQQQQREAQAELLLCLKTEEIELSLNETDASSSATTFEKPNKQTTTQATATAITTITTTTTTTTTIVSQQQRSTTKSTTGAIPKSISFDASADKVLNSNSGGGGIAGLPLSALRSARLPAIVATTGNAGGHHHTHSGIFNKLKQGIFKHRRGQKNQRLSGSGGGGGVGGGSVGGAQNDEFSHSSSRSVSFSTNASEVSLDLLGAAGSVGRNVPLATYCDITEDILAKYRRKVSTSSEATNSDSIAGGGGAAGGVGIDGGDLCAAKSKLNAGDRSSLPAASTHHDKTVVFNAVKKKIRTVLSKTDLHTSDFRHTTHSNSSPLLTYLQIQLAQSLNLQNFQQISYINEAIRCIAILEPAQHAQLMEELQNDIQKRQHYLQYLMRYRQNLLLIMENVDQYESRLRNESNNCNRYMVALCVRLFMEKREANIEAFQEEFSHLTVSDDKIELIEEFIDRLMEEAMTSGGFLFNMPDWLVQESRIALERILLQRMYQQVMFPNEDADLSRDGVLSEHIRKLQQVIRPTHPLLCIRQEYLGEAPWSFAQQQLSFISAYKTPREKLHCVMRCISSIMSLLHMSSDRVPSADDLLPVLIYVVIMANPPYLLSTVEYITCFIGEKLDGEEQFHWTLFCSVVRFIKTMDYLQ